ncbi:MAG: divergent polysaccharide deacetylase family protein [Treponema sp.]|nr:divergent polysaccharide deacetylase family protein [Treponema sp.]
MGILVVASIIFIRMLLLRADAPLVPEDASDYPQGMAQESLIPEHEVSPVTQEPAAGDSPPEDPLDTEGPGAPSYQPPPSPPKGILGFVIDDAGNNLKELEPFLRFPGPLTIAVLPGLPYSVEAARRIRASGKELFLHQPMEALGGQNPGPGAIYAGMPADTIRAVVKANLAEIGPVAGMNNHQGSKITMDSQAMETILRICHEQGIYFLDSRTIADTVVPDVAKRLGIPIEERDVFIDNIQEKSAMIQYVQEGLRKAAWKGSAVLIGHAWSPELAALLDDLYPELVKQGYSFATISRLIQDPSK